MTADEGAKEHMIETLKRDFIGSISSKQVKD